MIRFSLYKKCLNYQPRQMIFSEGGNPKGLFCISSGKIKISKISDEGKEQIVRLAKEGDIIGYRALLSDEKYSCSAIAINEISLCFIPKSAFLEVMAGNGELALKMMTLLAGDLKKAENKIMHLSHKSVRERMAEVLLVLKETYGCEKNNSTININFTRTEIGTLAGITRETATRILYEFSDAGMLELNGNKIAIINQKELLKTANIFD
jgi:CRP/FNR family transcriptional regulator